jgi:UDP-3-O-[3-hydroxymyristoyl] glucosamine N-acyltransferase
MQYTLTQLTNGLDVVIKGDPNCVISGVSPIQQAKPQHISFLTNSLYKKYLATTEASAVILAEADVADCPTNAIISRDPYYTYAKIAAFFDTKPVIQPGVHASAVIGENTQIDPTASIGAHSVIGANVKIGAGVVIGPGCIIEDGVEIGEGSRLDPRVTVYHHVKLGKRVRIASGVVIGSDGFGFANLKGVWHKVPQLGSVEIGDDVDIGANTAIDRGAVENTVIENGVKLDNLIQVGHNVRIGAHTVIAGCVGIAGSAQIGRHCMIGGATMIAGHISIADKVMITGGTSVSSSIRESGLYSSGIVGVVTNQEFRKNNAHFHRLGNLTDRVKNLEVLLKDQTERK